ncbi:YceI family protein [Phaeacidiphilus oryzae]|uniref:YceI family protein n=1 Tax=Phaeacidiphilus oryzae TaxID=348818 RepID=UPI000565521D|nr:YceI family protein [Phaeacidiphilus oryzae]
MSTDVATGSWKLDSARSNVAFKQKGMWGLVTVRGTFTTVSGEGEVYPDGTAAGAIAVDSKSVDTGNAKRDQHLRSADFFECERHPTITFAVARAATGEGDKVQVEGELTVRGVSRPQAVEAVVRQEQDGSVVLSTEFQVERADHGITWNQLSAMRGPTTVSATLHFTRAGTA